MAKHPWIPYGSDDAVKAGIRGRLSGVFSGIRVVFGGAEPAVEGEALRLPADGQICWMGRRTFVLRHIRQIEESERGYRPDRHELGSGDRWLPAWQANEDERYFFGPEDARSAGCRDETEYFYAGAQHGRPFVRKISAVPPPAVAENVDSLVAWVKETLKISDPWWKFW